MNGLAVIQGDDAQVAAKLCNPHLLADAAIFWLGFAFYGLRERQLDPFFAQVGALDEHFVAEVVCAFHAYLAQVSFKPVILLNTTFPSL